ncbi:hypothetical protein O6H91_20G049600 [Diphasiastrum complanatum]|uniref:Uncharacterized protein n=1 Tax=Diphasiastrum complanatum TaxID=34168 RepID=A0ACC2AQ81_DIPCM|nr:hypothetical protein O6H91_20G049600 [Diphasiastrum complanatum]
MVCKLMEWGCQDSLSLDSAAELASSTKHPSTKGLLKFSSHHPALQRCLSSLPGRTPVLHRRVINLRLEESQHLMDYTMESIHPYGELKLPSSDMDDVMRGHQLLYLKRWPPSPLGSQI